MNAVSAKPILIVDDNPTNLKLLRVTLEAEGLEVFEAADGLEALQQLEREPIGAIISDILMPRMDGYRLCYEVRKSERWRQVPFIFYTNTYTSPADETLARDLGGEKFLCKPAAAPAILTALDEVMRAVRPASSVPLELPRELELMQEYSVQLVAKLVDKNLDLEQRTNELQAAEERYRALAETAHDLIFSADRAGVMTYINSHGAQEFGRPAREIVGKSQSELFPPAIAQANSAAWAQVLATGQPLHDESQRPFQGRQRWHATWVVPLKNAAGEITGVMGIARDITDRKQAEQLRSCIASSLSHELNTPLSGILGFLDVARSSRAALSREQLGDCLEQIHGSAQRLHRLIQRNLTYAELELFVADPSQAVHLWQQPTQNLRSFTQDLAQNLAREHGRGADLELKLVDATAPFNARFLARLLTEILDNAFKFSPQKTPVSFVSREEGDALVFEVQDAGRGMSQQQIADVGAFVQFDREHFEQQGVGLGLHLGKRIAELLSGSLQIGSPPAGGTRVTAFLPKSPKGPTP